MRIRTCGTERAADRRAGFTLLELLAVLAIIALVAETVSLRSSRSFGVAHFRAVLTSTSAIMRQARSRAIGNARSEAVVIDLDRRHISLPSTGQAFDFPPEVGLALECARRVFDSSSTESMPVPGRRS